MKSPFLTVLAAAILAYNAALGAPVAPPPSQEVQDMLRQADAAAERGETLEAIQRYHSAIILAPSYPEAYNRLAQFYLTTRQPDMAQKYFSIALEVDPGNPEALMGLAMLSLAAGDIAAAQARHDVLRRACGESCPETAQLGEALSAALPYQPSGGATN